jgi:mobilome CxxCx(11)CxxC protein
MTDADFVKRCADREIYAYGTAYLFESRSRSIRFRLRILSFLSLAVPLSVGGIAMVAADASLLPFIVAISGILSIPLFVMTLWSLVFRWEERLAASEQSCKINHELMNGWSDLAQYTGPDAEEKSRLLLERDRIQEQSDIMQDVSAKDKRLMMRASLIQYGRKCAICGVQPVSMSAKGSSCSNCGDF